MKKYIYKLSIILVAITFTIGCQKQYPIMFDKSTSVIGFSTTTLSIKENDISGAADIYLGGEPNLAATDVTVEVSVEGISKPAVEGTDFTISSKTVSVSVGEAAVTIRPIDNSLLQGNKQFKLFIISNSKSYSVSAQDTVTITITDDEHPLKEWIGTYKVSAASYGNPGVWDEQWTVITSPVEGDVTKLSMKGIGSSSSSPIIATIDKNQLIITIVRGQNIGAPYGPDYPDNVEVYYGFQDLTLDQNVDITGTVNLNGTINIDHWGELYKDPTGDWVWDVFKTTWIKQ